MLGLHDFVDFDVVADAIVLRKGLYVPFAFELGDVDATVCALLE